MGKMIWNVPIDFVMHSLCRVQHCIWGIELKTNRKIVDMEKIPHATVQWLFDPSFRYPLG